MKKISYIILIFALALGIPNSGCKKFLNVEPLNKLSGNNFWTSEKDAESFATDIHRLFRNATMSSVLFAVGDERCAPIRGYSGANPYRHDFDYMAKNNLRLAIAARADGPPRILNLPNAQLLLEWFQNNARYDLIPNWTPFFRVIQSCNIMYKEIDLIPKSEITDAKRNQYKAEAVFMRSMAYYFLVRLYGDVPYYKEAYQQDAMPRTNMVNIFNDCVTELKKVKDNLPWTYTDPANRGVRAMRGGALALMMHMNMWNAGFDAGNAKKYYEETVAFGDEIHELGVVKERAYRLLPIEQTYQIMFGRSQEGLYEIQLSDNYGESTARNRFKFSVGLVNQIFAPAISDRNYTELTFYPAYMSKIYPETLTDKRKQVWFDANMYKTDGTAVFYKMFNKSATTQSSDDNPIVFRLADTYLLQAEALAELGTDDTKAAELLNKIRTRAGADLYPADPGEGKLKDAIFWERCKELMGEGHYFYDLVRTKKILNPDYCYNPLTYSAFIAGAWTWPIDRAALTNNPYMTLNNYWQ
ncbi:RagB/SusD family nutrient uptake outer membrane protein [Pedobacter chitinilyticus]|uniref:RagB/SusD family nutrient uptake outer membrane protein n=1 Tax=Pedobacter chitinilyticus TaxID=2233776 RepID=A0A443YMQ6_9SPHI|nr:RagB/SusD family nutrient uptake outer membrane protein [Pedobacter chitinilyticus]RWU05072.1 RagB/SusD family nutrient uptake outer membrane protein [Pedobacter chitinilyticus]